MNRTFVGFGFGPIMSGLFLLEAWKSGNFGRLVVAEVNSEVVREVRAAGGRFTVNVAHDDGIRHETVEGVEILNPHDETDRRRLVSAIAESEELATALPSVATYAAEGANSVAGLIARGLAHRPEPRETVIYAAENNNDAAELLARWMQNVSGSPPPPTVAFLDTVIGKMSGVITDDATMTKLKLVPMTPGTKRAVLVEAFNRILIARVPFANFARGITAFVEKAHLEPFEEAKLFGHNAVHALLAYRGLLEGLETMADLAVRQDLLAAGRRAFLGESRPAMIHRWGKIADSLFTPAGYAAYADDLLKRMMNPYLHDLLDRVARDPMRKLGWDDRLIGTMRRALEAGVEPRSLATGPAAALIAVSRGLLEAGGVPKGVIVPEKGARLTRQAVADCLLPLWHASDSAMADRLVTLTWEGCVELMPELA